MSSFKDCLSKDGELLKLLKADDPNCGVPKKEVPARRRQKVMDPLARSRILRETLINWPAWDLTTTEMIMMVSKKAFKPKTSRGQGCEGPGILL